MFILSRLNIERADFSVPCAFHQFSAGSGGHGNVCIATWQAQHPALALPWFFMSETTYSLRPCVPGHCEWETALSVPCAPLVHTGAAKCSSSAGSGDTEGSRFFSDNVVYLFRFLSIFLRFHFYILRCNANCSFSFFSSPAN